jgi:hypothetical protein
MKESSIGVVPPHDTCSKDAINRGNREEEAK